MAHGTKIIDLIGPDLADDLSEVGGVSQITIVEEEADLFMMPVTVQMLDAGGVER